MSIREQAKSELERSGITGDDGATIRRILDIFFDQFDSGGSVSVMAPVLIRCLAGAPLTPLTGEDGEWRDMSEYESAEPGTLFQNTRASSVFKRLMSNNLGTYYEHYDVGQEGSGFNGFLRIDQFPYMPDHQFSDPIITITTED